MTDSEVAKRVGRSRLAVQARRGQIGIRKYGSDLRPWTDQEEKLLGTVPDKELVSRLNRGYEAIAFRRQKLRIPPCRPQAWQPEEEAILGTQSDEEIGRILGRTKVAVRPPMRIENSKRRRSGPPTLDEGRGSTARKSGRRTRGQTTWPDGEFR
jgi:hypothetical protein